MQYVLQKYILHTCHESAQSGPPIMCFHPGMGFMFHFFWFHSICGTMQKLKAWARLVGFNYDTSIGVRTNGTKGTLAFVNTSNQVGHR
jgi:hypothetical protein